MTDINSTPCCGLQIIDELDQSSPKIMEDICEEKYRSYNKYQQAFLIFTDDVAEKNGERFARFIKRKGFGEVYSTPARKNPNSGHMIKVWTWAPNESKLKAWYQNL